jgi:hypothetical protein
MDGKQNKQQLEGKPRERLELGEREAFQEIPTGENTKELSTV